MKKTLLLLGIILLAGIYTFAEDSLNNIRVKNIGEHHSLGTIFLLHDGNTQKWVRADKNALDVNQVMKIIILAFNNNWKLTILVDSWSSQYPLLKYVKLNTYDFDY